MEGGRSSIIVKHVLVLFTPVQFPSVLSFTNFWHENRDTSSMCWLHSHCVLFSLFLSGATCIAVESFYRHLCRGECFWDSQGWTIHHEARRNTVLARRVSARCEEAASFCLLSYYDTINTSKNGICYVVQSVPRCLCL